MKKIQHGLLVLLVTCMVVLTCPATAILVLSIDVTDSQDPVNGFTPFTYRIDYTYSSIGTESATIIDQLPPEVSFVSATSGGIYDSATHSVRWDVDETFGSEVSVTVNPDRLPVPACMVEKPPVLIQNTATISSNTDSASDKEFTTIYLPLPVCGPEFSSASLPAAMIIGFVGGVMLIRRNR